MQDLETEFNLTSALLPRTGLTKLDEASSTNWKTTQKEDTDRQESTQLAGSHREQLNKEQKEPQTSYTQAIMRKQVGNTAARNHTD